MSEFPCGRNRRNRHSRIIIPPLPDRQRQKRKDGHHEILIALFLCLSLMAGIVPMMAESAAVTHEISSANYPFYLGTMNLGDISLYFLDSANDMPYIEATDMHGVLASIMNSATGDFKYRK